MPSLLKTAFLELSKWAGNEYPKREDFVSDNEKIDAFADDISSQMAQKVNKAGDTMSGNLNVPSLNNKVPAYAVTPTEIAITSGFASGWSGSISYRKNQENLVTLTVNIVKSTDIAAGQHLLFTLPTGVRPSDRATIFTNIHTSGSIPVQNASATITVIWDGSINLHTMPGATLTNARYLNNVVLSYYAV